MTDTPWKTENWHTSPWNFAPEVTVDWNFPEKIQIHDVTLRDGEQQAGLAFNFDDKIESEDIIFNKTVIDKNSLEIIKGSVIDYKKELIGNSFVIKNPQASASCGCGLSFSV